MASVSFSGNGSPELLYVKDRDLISTAGLASVVLTVTFLLTFVNNYT
jgi:hypothetical protein